MSGTSSSLGRALRVLIGLSWLLWAFVIGGSGAPGSFLMGTACVVAAAAVVVFSTRRLSSRQISALDAGLLAGSMVFLVLWVYTATYQKTCCLEDELALGQAAAQRLLGGHDPYGEDLSWALSRYNVKYITPTVNGDLVHGMSFPAGSFLPYVVTLLLGLRDQGVAYVSVAFWIVGIAMLWLMLPRQIRPAAALISTLPAQSLLTVTNGNDALCVPFLLAAVWRWDRFGDPDERSAARWLGPIGLGLACSVKQTPWFLAPFLLIGVAIEAHLGRRSAWRTVRLYASLALLAFLGPNLPFIVWGPRTWLDGALAPLFHNLVPLGDGFIGLSLFLGLGGGNLLFYALAGMAAALALAAALVGWYPAFKKLLPFLPAVMFLFPARSFVTYFVFAVPSLLVAATSCRPAAPGSWPSALRRWCRGARAAAYVGFAGALGFVAMAALAAAPLRVSIAEAHSTSAVPGSDNLGKTDGSLAWMVDDISLQVVNRTRTTQAPHFAVINSVYPAFYDFWPVRSGPASLGPGEMAQYVIQAPGLDVMPDANQEFAVYAFTTAPSALSSSPIARPSPYRAELTSRAIREVYTASQELTLIAQVVDRDGQPVRQAGLPVSLSQTVYDSGAARAAHTEINGGQTRESSAIAHTGEDGRAYFHIQGGGSQAQEVFYQASILIKYAQGQSNIVNVRFAGQ